MSDVTLEALNPGHPHMMKICASGKNGPASPAQMHKEEYRQQNKVSRLKEQIVYSDYSIRRRNLC